MRAFALLLLALATTSFSAADDIVGEWFTRGERSAVRIERKGDLFTGSIVWLKSPMGKDGKPLADEHNPDAKLQGRTLQGLEVLRGFHFDGKGKWEGGRIYDPKNGKEYESVLKLENHDVLAVRGFVGVAAFGRTETWTRRK